jgi:hypothetical protein
LAPFGPDMLGWRRLFLRVKRTAQWRARTSEFDPKPTWGKGVGLRLPLTRSDYREDR